MMSKLSLFRILVTFSQLFVNFGFLIDDNNSGNVTIRTSIGTIIGKIKYSTFDGKKYQVEEFLGIPYAEAPIGNNRFRKPVPKSAFTSPYFASSYGASCLQYQENGLNKSEDCLSLNIFVPHTSNIMSSRSNVDLAVMLWIHGGGFQHGSSSYYPSNVLSTFGNVIVVTINYRLAHLGFLPNFEGSSNFGLWDQHLAIKWVHQYISAFGGDRDRITIFGESAGSSAVIYQALYPGNKGLFQRVIAESGSITSEFAFDKNSTVHEVFTTFSVAIGCNSSHDQILCLRNKTTDEIAHAMKTVPLARIHPNEDIDFVPKHPFEMLKHSSDLNASFDFFQGLDLMTGSNSIDGALYLPEIAHNLNQTLDELKVPRSVYENSIISKTLANVFSDINHIPEAVKKAAIFEYTDWSNPDDAMLRNFMLTNFMTDQGMVAPMVATVQSHSKGQRGRTYLFRFSLQMAKHLIPVPKWLDGPQQSNHGDDLAYVFGFSDKMIKGMFRFRGGYNVTTEDIRRSKVVMTMWSNFAKSGNPNMPISLKPYLTSVWPAYNISTQNYLDIIPMMTASSVKQRIRAKQMRLWLEFLPQFLSN